MLPLSDEGPRGGLTSVGGHNMVRSTVKSALQTAVRSKTSAQSLRPEPMGVRKVAITATTGKQARYVVGRDPLVKGAK